MAQEQTETETQLPIQCVLSFPPLLERVLPDLSEADVANFLELEENADLRKTIWMDTFKRFLHQPHLYTLSLPSAEEDFFDLQTQGQLKYVYEPIDNIRKEFIRQLMLPNVQINAGFLDPEWFTLIGVKPPDGQENKIDPTLILNPLFVLYQAGNQDLLHQLYEQQAAYCQTIEAVTGDSHKPFGFDRGVSLQDYLMFFCNISDGHPALLALMNTYLQLLWAICTYQPVDEFKDLYAKILLLKEEYSDIPRDYLDAELLLYACYCRNRDMVKELCKTPDYHAFTYLVAGELESVAKLQFAQLIAENGGFSEDGLDPNIALYYVCKNKKEEFNIDVYMLLLKAGARPLELLKPKYSEANKALLNDANKKRLGLNMFWFHARTISDTDPSKTLTQITTLTGYSKAHK